MGDRITKIGVFLIELGIGILCGIITAVIILPVAYGERGYFAIGGEWFLIIFVAYAGFSAVNKYIFDRRGGKQCKERQKWERH